MIASALVCLPPQALAAVDLADLSIEELLNESVTSVSKREQRRGDAAAAIAVLSNDDLRRSGVTSIAEALRLVPGMHVGAVNAGEWAVSARGFNSLYANKLLVLVDGRAVYTPLFGGVFWDLQQPMLEDLDRVEAIRGPGATVWGANAVNGVVNIVSRSARETQGGLIVGGGGSEIERLGGLRYGGQAGEDTFYRVFVRSMSVDDSPLANGQPAGDAWRGWSGGFRVDRFVQEDVHLTWQADVTESDVASGVLHSRNWNTLGRWTREFGERSSLRAQAYVDVIERCDLARSDTRMETVDLTFEHTLGLGERNDVIWGVGYRGMRNRLAQTNPAILVTNPAFDLSLFSAFVQDEFQAVPEKLTLTAGVKLERNGFTGWEVQPSVRGVWKPVKTQTVWAAVSRAVRTPSALEDMNIFTMPSGEPLPGPDGNLYLPVITGNGNPSAEAVWSYEAGWRVQPREFISFDLALFYNDYERTIAPLVPTRFVPGSPFGTMELPFTDTPGMATYGGELAVTVAPTSAWRVTASYSVMRDRLAGFPSTDPERLAVLRSSHDFGRFGVDVQVRHVGGFVFPITWTAGRVPSYVEADVRLSYRPTDDVEISVVGQNLLESQHPEQGPTFYSVTAEVPRRVFGKITWKF